MRLLVTGSHGQVGTELMARLDRRDDVEATGVDIDTCDLADRGSAHDLVRVERPDVIIHCAAFTAVDRCEAEPETAFRANALATRYLAEGAREVGAHVVYVSTDYVFDGSKGTPYVEWDLPSPRSVYGLSKLGGERELDPAWTIARTSWVCSAHGSNMVKTVLRLAGEHETLSFVDDQVGHPTFAGDLAATLIALGEARAAGVHHVTNSGEVSWYGFVRAIMEAAGHDPDRVLPVSTTDFLAARPADAPPMAERPAYSVLDNLALRAGGFAEMRDFREPLGEVVAALAAAG